MTERVIIAGAGGQGIMLLGKIVAMAAMRENRYTTWLPCYGAEVRGGTAYCMVTISDVKIGSPFIDLADTLIIMNAPSMGKFRQRIKRNGLLIVNSSLVDVPPKMPVRAFAYPFTDTALRLGNIKMANVVSLGSFLAARQLFKVGTVLKIIEQFAPVGKTELIESNKKALMAGIGFHKQEDVA